MSGLQGGGLGSVRAWLDFGCGFFICGSLTCSSSACGFFICGFSCGSAISGFFISFAFGSSACGSFAFDSFARSLSGCYRLASIKGNLVIFFTGWCGASVLIATRKVCSALRVKKSVWEMLPLKSRTRLATRKSTNTRLK